MPQEINLLIHFGHLTQASNWEVSAEHFKVIFLFSHIVPGSKAQYAFLHLPKFFS